MLMLAWNLLDLLEKAVRWSRGPLVTGPARPVGRRGGLQWIAIPAAREGSRR